MSLLKHIKNALREKPVKEKIEGQLRREHGVIDGHRGRRLAWEEDSHRVHVLTDKKPLFARGRAHEGGGWRVKTYHWNDNHKITHYQNYTDMDHHTPGFPPIRRISGIFQPNDRLDHMSEAKNPYVDRTIPYGPDGHPHKILQHMPALKAYVVSPLKIKGGKFTDEISGHTAELMDEPTVHKHFAVKTKGGHLKVAKEGTVTQLPGTNRWKVGDRVTHPEHSGKHVIYSIPTLSDDRHPKTDAIIHIDGKKHDLSSYKRVKLKDLKLA